MNNNTKKQINIELFNIDSITNSSLTYFFNSNLCEFAQISANKHETQLYILDAQRYLDSLEQIINSIKSPHQFVIILYMNEKPKLQKDNSILYLEKPIKTDGLKLLLNEIYGLIYTNKIQTDKKEELITSKPIQTQDSSHLHIYDAISHNEKDSIHQQFKAQKYVGSNKNIEVDGSDINHIYIHKEKYLYTHLLHAIRIACDNRTSVVIKNQSNEIYYDYSLKIFYFNISSLQLQYLQKTPLNISEISILKVNYKANTQFKQSSQERFIWESTLQASRGRIPTSTSLTSMTHMINWPNYSDLPLFRHAIQISALWSVNPMSLLDTAKFLAIPQRYVFTLYSALEALSCIKLKPTNSSSKSHTYIKSKEIKHKSIFSKILSHLFK